MTSHDVVAKVRRIVKTRRVGHAGTLDPMATGVLVLGVERATKLLNHLVLTDKTYEATIRLGASTTTDDAEGELVATGDTSALTSDQLAVAIASLTGQIMQRPSSVSAIKVDGQRAYARVRAGETVELQARPVIINRFEVTAEPRREGNYLDLDVSIDCSSGTYIRALARDLGDALKAGGHLTALRRSRVGPFTLTDALPLAELAGLAERGEEVGLPLPAAIAAAMPIRIIAADEARELSFGRTIPAAGIEGTYGGIDESGSAVALLAESGGRARPILGFTPAGEQGAAKPVK
jgi:tRNA pseudouridine55 synthase